MSDERRIPERQYYRVKISIPVQRSEYIVRVAGFDEAGQKALQADRLDCGEEGIAEPGGIKSIEVYSDDGAIIP